MNFQELLAPSDPAIDIEEALESWRWLIPEPVILLAMTAFGDLFVIAADGSVLFLDTAAGSCCRVAESRMGWQELLGDKEQVEQWFMPALLTQLLSNGVSLAEGQCFTPKRSICFGGELIPGNWQPGSWRVHLYRLGQLHEQLKDLPDGARITKINFTPM